MAGQIKVAVVSGAISSSGTGTADFTKAGFGTPKACIVLLSFDTADNTSVAVEGKASIGFSDFTNHRCITHQDEDGSAKVDSDCRKSPTKAYVLLNVAGAVDVDGIASTITDGVRLTNTTNGSASAVFATVIMFGGADLQVSLDSITTPNLIGGTTVVTTGIPQDLVFFIGVDIAAEDSSSTGINNSFGVVDISNDQATIVNRCIGWASDHNNNVGSPASVLRNDRCLKIITEVGGEDWEIELTAATTTSYTITERDVASGANMEIYALALNLNDRGSKVGSVDSPISGTSWTPAVALGFIPQYVGLGLTHLTVEQIISIDLLGGGNGISSNTGAGEETFHGWYNEDNSLVTNTNNNFRSRVIDFRNHSVLSIVQNHSHSSFNNGDWTYTINTENEGTARKWFYWAIEEGETDTVIDIPTGSLTLTGFVPLVLENTIVNIPVASIVLTGFVPTVLEGEIINIPVASLPLAGLVVTLDESIPIPVATLILTSFAVGFQVDVPVASLALTGFAPTVLEGTNVNVPTGSLVLTGFASTHDIAIPIPVASLSLTGLVPVTIESTDVEIPVASLALTAFIPVAVESTIINVPVASLALTGLVPLALENTVVNVPVTALNLTGFIATVLEGTIVSVPVATLNLTGFAPIIDRSISIPAANLTFLGFVPTVIDSGAGGITVQVPLAILTLKGFAPIALESGDAGVTIPFARLRLISFAPNVVLTLYNTETCDMDIIFPKNVDKLIIPVLQSIEFNLDRLKNINLPSPVTVEDIGEFKALEPVSAAKEVERITFLYADFALTVQNVIDGKIAELIGEVKPYDVEMIEWGRQKEDLLEESEESVEVSFDGEASRGFVAPSGVFNKDISRQSLKLKKSISRANEIFFSEQNAKTLQNITDGLQAGNQAEVIVRKTDVERQTINLQAVQNLVEIDFRVFEIYLERHNSSIEIKRIKHQAWLEEIRAQLLILQERELSIKGHTLNLEERTKQVDMFNIAIDYLNAKQALKEIDLENFILQAETEKNKLLKFQAEVDKFSALINLNIAKFNLYKAGIDFEESKVDKFREEAAVAGAQLDVQNARTTAGRITADTKIDIANAKLQAQLEKLRAARSRLDTALSTGRARIVNFSGDLLVYQSELRDWLTENTDEILENITQKESKRDLDVTGLRDLSRQDVNVIQFNTEAQNIADLGNLNAEVISKSAKITAKTEITSKLIHSLVGG